MLLLLFNQNLTGAAGVAGPYNIEATELYVPGADASEVFVPGGAIAEVYVPGQQQAEVDT